MRVRRTGGGVRVRLSREEGWLLRALADQVRTLLDPPATDPEGADPLEVVVGLAGDVSAPDDPALHRLLPDAYADADAAGEFRRLTDGDLRRTKAAALDRLLADVDDGSDTVTVTLAPDAAEAWLGALNDVRLVLGVRLDVTEDVVERFAGLAADDPRLPLVYGYELLTVLQEAIVDALDN